VRIGKGTPDLKFRTIKKDTLIKTSDGTWSKLIDVYREGLGVSDNNGENTGLRANKQGAVFLNTIINDGSNIFVDSWFPALRAIFAPIEKTEILNEIVSNNNFGLRYDQLYDRWKIIKTDNLNSVDNFSSANAGSTTASYNDASWLIRLEYSPTTATWSAIVRRDQTVFGSSNQITFQNQRFGKALDSTTKRVINDSIKFLKQNAGFTQEIGLDIVDYFKLDDGRYDTRRVLLLSPGIADSLVPTIPNAVNFIVSPGDTINLEALQFIDAVGQYTLAPTATGTITVSGKQNLKVQHNHVPLRDNRIDATTTNIIDMFVLTSEYNTNYRNWINAGGVESAKPLALTSFGLEKLMSKILPYKSISDSIVFHPVKYKVIFGKTADLRNQVTIRVTKSDTTRTSDAEIRSRVISAINAYFAIDNWDFGETFYFTDMAAWVHKSLGGVISSITLIPKQRLLTSVDMFQIPCESDEVLVSSATVGDVEIVTTAMSVTNK